MIEKIEQKMKYIIKAVIIFTIFYFSKYLQFIPLKLFKIDVKNISNAMVVVLSTFSSLIILFIYFLIYRNELKKDFKDFKKNKNEYFDTGIKYWMIGLTIMFITNFILNFVLKAGGANNEKSIQAMIKALPLLMLIDAGFIAPFNEEIVFRKSLKDVFKNKWLFVIVSFILFGGAHVITNSKTLTDYLFIIPYGTLGASFAYAYYKTNNIFTSISLHMLHNTVLILISISAMFAK